MSRISDYLSDVIIKQHALTSNFVYGKAIFERGGVEIINNRDDRVEAWAGGLAGTIREGAGSRRRVTLMIEHDALHWHCTGNPKNHQIFCKHCVAVALAIKDLG